MEKFSTFVQPPNSIYRRRDFTSLLYNMKTNSSVFLKRYARTWDQFNIYILQV